ncbi:MAG: HEAT repeat domain-containing protein, partial [Verrucomicrobiales bacterium]|nr:HEAT repeat domain-containing protein [Verrucomicrobiales bacterium]
RKGRIFVGEVNRFWQGVPDLRGVNEFIAGDFQSQTLEDREKLQNSIPGRFPEGFFTNTADRLIRLEDRDGNGAADHRTLFSNQFSQPLDGLGFSVLPEDDAVYFTCIPNLWKLTDTNDDGVADSSEALLTGFGTRISFIGHDLHGITRGPDGRLYFSVGDRGYHITSKEGQVFTGAGIGAIFRCESDGSGFEVFCKGLRNPTELAFDDLGNLFTFDNTGDFGDVARMVYALEGTDSGWNMKHQSPHQYVDALDWEDFHPAKSMWVAERMHEPFNDEQPQWLYPPAAHVARGPSGVTWVTGEAAPEDLRGKFLLTDYGGAVQSCKLRAIGVKPQGAGYTLDSDEVIASGVGISDVELGFDGGIYLCDFGGGWTINTNGAIHVLTPRDKTLQATAAEMAAKFKRGVSADSVAQLTEALHSPDRRLRQMAQFELVKRGAEGIAALSATAKDASQKLPVRLHGVWGLGQAARQQGADTVKELVSLSHDAEPEVRANAARTLGDLQGEAARARILEMLDDSSTRVRSLAAAALSRLAPKGDAAAIAALYRLAESNNEDPDPVVRHACLTGLDRIATESDAVAHANDAKREVRLMAVLQLRRLASAELVRFLKDSDTQIRYEAIRAIYDTDAMDTSAGTVLAMLDKVSELPATLQRRIVAANYRLGTAENGSRLMQIAADESIEMSNREAALQGLRLWEKQVTADPVFGGYRAPHGAHRAQKALGGTIGEALKQFLASNPPPALAALALKLADASAVSLDESTLMAQIRNAKLDTEVRVAALDSLVKSSAPSAAQVVTSLLTVKAPALAAAALRHGHAMNLPGIADAARQAIEKAPLPAARAGIDVIAELAPTEALAAWKNRQSSGLRPALWLDLFLALQASSDPAAKQETASFSSTGLDAVPNLSTTGGDQKHGEVVFRNQGGCLQCHVMGKDGGIQGPPLTLVGERLQPQKLVESLINPNAEIAPGYGLSSVTLEDGSLLVGRIAAEPKDQLTVVTMDGKSTELARSKVKAIAPPVSAMPPMGLSLPPRDLRDLVAYLATRNAKSAPKDSGAEHGEAKVAK